MLYVLGMNWQCYNYPPLIGTALLANNSVLITEVSFGRRELYIHTGLARLLPSLLSFIDGMSSLESVL